MFIRIILPTLALAILAPGSAFAGEGQAPSPKVDAPALKADATASTLKDEPSVVINSTCPMDGNKVDHRAGTVPVAVGTGADTKHFNMGFCSMACCTAFAKDPAPALTGKLAPGPKTNSR